MTNRLISVLVRRSPALLASLALGAVVSLSGNTAWAGGEVIPVDYSVELVHRDWVPIEPEDMERASVDAAFARLSDVARLEVQERLEARPTAASKEGHLHFSISLVGPAETIQLTMRLDTPGAATAVATTAVSVARLDHRGIFEAFQHAGRTTAERLIPNLPERIAAPDGQDETPGFSPELKAVYDRAQNAKRARRFEEAARLFGEVARRAGGEDEGIARLATDELRYGLPSFEAQQLINDVGSFMGSPSAGDRGSLMARAENLYRQIEAENAGHVSRVAEAQRAIDSLLVSRRALANARRAATLSKASVIRMQLTETVMVEGACPDAGMAERLVSSSRTGFELDGTSDAAGGKRVYRLLDPASGGRVELECDGYEIRLAQPGADRSKRPAARPSGY